MDLDIPFTDSPAFVTTLAQAAVTFRGARDIPSAEAVVNALLNAEKVAKQQRLTYPFESLLGCWRLCFATGTRKVRQRGGIVLGKGFYVPKLTAAYISFATQVQTAVDISDRGEISNQVHLGALLLKLTGPCQYLNKKNLLAFDFNQMQISLFGLTVYDRGIRGGKAQAQNFYSQLIAKRPFFAFFWVTEDFIAARGRGGGLALWVRAN